MLVSFPDIGLHSQSYHAMIFFTVSDHTYCISCTEQILAFSFTHSFKGLTSLENAVYFSSESTSATFMFTVPFSLEEYELSISENT